MRERVWVRTFSRMYVRYGVGVAGGGRVREKLLRQFESSTFIYCFGYSS